MQNPVSGLASLLRGDGTLKYGDVHEKFIFLEIQDLKPLRTGKKQFETILPNFTLDECKKGKYTVVYVFSRSNGLSNGCLL